MKFRYKIRLTLTFRLWRITNSYNVATKSIRVIRFSIKKHKTLLRHFYIIVRNTLFKSPGFVSLYKKIPI